MKKSYGLRDADSGIVIADSKQYNDDLALMWALRILPKLKRENPALRRCQLLVVENRKLRKVQSFKKGD